MEGLFQPDLIDQIEVQRGADLDTNPAHLPARAFGEAGDEIVASGLVDLEGGVFYDLAANSSTLEVFKVRQG